MQNGEIPARVVQDRGGWILPAGAADLNPRVVDPRDDVGVREDVPLREHEPGAVDVPVAVVGHAVDLHHAGTGATDRRRRGDLGGRRRYGTNALRRQAAEDGRQAVVVEGRPDGAEGGVRPVGHRCIDAADHLRAADLPRKGGDRTRPQGGAQGPGDQQQGQDAEPGPEQRVDHLGRPPGQAATEGTGERGEQQLAEQGEHHHDADGEHRLRELGVHPRDQHRRDEQAGHAARDEPGEAEHPDHEALPVAGDREHQGRHGEQHVQSVHGRSSRAGVSSGRSWTRPRSQGCSHPASRSIRSSSPPVKPQTSSSSTRNAAPTYPLG